jgi:hypothetical protein
MEVCQSTTLRYYARTTFRSPRSALPCFGPSRNTRIVRPMRSPKRHDVKSERFHVSRCTTPWQCSLTQGSCAESSRSVRPRDSKIAWETTTITWCAGHAANSLMLTAPWGRPRASPRLTTRHTSSTKPRSCTTGAAPSVRVMSLHNRNNRSENPRNTVSKDSRLATGRRGVLDE